MLERFRSFNNILLYISPKVTAWLIGFHFFENQRGQSVTVNSERCTGMLRDCLFPQLQNFKANNYATWFKRAVRRGEIAWPFISPDLTPPDFFLWGYYVFT